MKNFVPFDGEGIGLKPHNYFLLAALDDYPLIEKNRKQLPLLEMLDYLTQDKFSESVNVWFSFNYDCNMILRELPIDLQTEVFHSETIQFGNYRIKYIPKKILSIKTKGKVYTHYDVFGFFQTAFVKSLENWKIEVPEIIVKGKAARENFGDWTNKDIIEYNNQELILLRQLMEKLEIQLLSNNINLSSYHGAGTIANYLLNHWNFKYFLPNKDSISKQIALWRRKAYFGGRIELFKRGYFYDIFHYDINSAYPSAMRTLPALNNAQWDYIENPSKNDLIDANGNPLFGMVKVKWTSKSIVGCLPYRNKNGQILFPQNGAGIYHIVEVLAALSKSQYKIKMESARILRQPYTFMLNDKISELAKERLRLKKINVLQSYPLKLGMNSIYGKLAQKPNEKGKLPQFRELLFGGYVTAFARAQLLKYINSESVILFATDGIYSTTKVNCPIGDNLGEFEFSKHEKGLFLLAGIYEVDNELKTRGYSNKLNVVEIWNHQAAQNNISLLNPRIPFKVPDRRFIGIRKGLTFLDKSIICTFQDEMRKISIDENRKRVFFGNNHTTSTPSNNTDGEESYPYLDNIMGEEEYNDYYDDFTE